MDRALELDRTAGSHRLDGVSAGNLVAKTGPSTEMILQSDPVIQTNVSPTLDVLFRRILARQAGCAGAARSPQQAARHGSAAQAPDLRAGRPRDLGAVGAFHRSRTADQFRDRGSTAEHRRIHADGAGRAPRRPGRRAASAALAAGGIDGRAQSHRGAGDRDIGQDRRRQSCRPRHERRRRSVFDPPCLRLRQ